MSYEPQAPDYKSESARIAAERENLPARRKADSDEGSHADIYRFCLARAQEAGFKSVTEAIAYAKAAKEGANV